MGKFRVRFEVDADKCSTVFKVANLMKRYASINEHLLDGEKIQIGSFKVEVNA